MIISMCVILLHIAQRTEIVLGVKYVKMCNIFCVT